MAWFEELGFADNPFDTDPAASVRSAVSLDKPLDELEYHVRSGSIIFVEGPSGSGKSVLLKALAGKFGGRAVFVDGDSDSVDIRSVIRKKTSLLDRLFGNSPKNLVLLADNAAGLSAGSMELVKYHYDNNNFGAVVFAGESLKSAGFSPAVLDRIGTRVIRLHLLSEDEAVVLVRNRLGSSAILGDGAIRKIYKMSGKNAKSFLELCDKACAAAVASKSPEITGEHLDSIKAGVPLGKSGKRGFVNG